MGIGGIVLFAIGAVLKFAYTGDQQVLGFDISVIAIILMIVGAIIFLLDLAVFLPRRRRSRTTTATTPDGQGGVVRETRHDDRI